MMMMTFFKVFLTFCLHYKYYMSFNSYLAQTPEIGKGLGRFLSCGARKQERT